MTPSQKTAAAKSAIETITRLLESAPDFGECGITLTFHGGELRYTAEFCKRTNQREAVQS